MSAVPATQSFGDRARLWGVAIRAFAFPASIVPVILGSAYAWFESRKLGAPQFHWGVFVLALLAGMLYHVAVNLLNDYYDFAKGVDHEGSFGGSGVLVARTMTPRQVANGAYFCIAIGTLIGLYFVYSLSPQGGGPYPFGWPILLIGGIGLVGTLWYTSARGSAKYNALGNPLVFLMFGPGYVLGAYLLQQHNVTWDAVWVSLPVGFIVAAILHANDTRDIAYDRAAGIRTIATVLGAHNSRVFYSFEVFTPYVLIVLLAVLGVLPWPALLALLTFPLALQLHKLFWTVRDEVSDKLMPSVENTAKLHMAFGLLMTIGVIIGGFMAHA